MANLPSSFIITLDGTPIAKNDEGQISHAETDGSNPAVFTLNDGLLESDGWYLGRSLSEDRGLLPKRVFWHMKGSEDSIQKTTIDEDENGELVIKNGGAVLVLHDGKVFGELLQERPAAVGIHPA
ncbi:hypothetical protein N7467_004683 [Penicillium canescens]|nr:hypothetical protein N7467_004683 [Penicillium canescens]